MTDEKWRLEVDPENDAGEVTGRVVDDEGRIVHADWWLPEQDERTPRQMRIIAAAPETARKLDSLLKAANRALAAMDDCGDFGISEAWGDPDNNATCENLRVTIAECENSP